MPTLKVYRTEVRQLFQNLISNALKFRREGEKPEIRISASKEANHWRFAVTDNGLGIAKEHQSRVFAIFQRLHTREEFEGTGIGLAHCRKIVELHGGHIWVESQPGLGSTFYFTIPLSL